MKFIIVTTPGVSHVLPLVPFARAAESAGHDVLTVAAGRAHDTAGRSGLTSFDPAAEIDVGAPYYELARRAVDEDLDPEQTRVALFEAFDTINRSLRAGLSHAAVEWAADAIVYPPMAPVGRGVAEELGIRSILHHVGLRHPEFPVPWLAPAPPDVEISISPERLDSAADPGALSEATTLFRMAPRCFNGSTSLPLWALSQPAHPRVLATLGSVHQSVDSGQLYGGIIEATRRQGAELVLTTGGASLDELPSPLPEHVRLVEWIPLSHLLPTCDVIIHHGGAGTNHSAFVEGVPQIIIPTTKGDALTNAEVTAHVGSGVWLPPADAGRSELGTALDAVLNDRRYADACSVLKQEFADLTDPHVVVSAVVDRVDLSATAT